VAQTLTIALSLSLTGRYAAMGRQAEAAMRLFTRDVNDGGGIIAARQRYELALECIDDQSRAARAEEIYRELCAGSGPRIIFGPYSSDLTRSAAPIVETAGMLLINHGGADDRIHERGNRMIVGVLTPAGEYMKSFVHLLTTLKFWRKRVAIVSSESPFGRAVAAGAERECNDRRARRRGVRVRLKYAGAFAPEETPELLGRALRRNRVNVMISAGGYEHDVAMTRLATRPHHNIPAIACVAAGVDAFRVDLGEDAEGIVGVSQWDSAADIRPEIGPSAAEFARRMRAATPRLACDYPAAQAYAAGLIAIAAIRAADSIEHTRMRAALSDLRTTTLYGNFEIDRASGRQIGHQMTLVQWHGGRKVIIEAEPSLGEAIEFPSGWRLLLASWHYLRIGRRDDSPDDSDEEAEDGGKDEED
jgi:branched-chain amino acid transport system substrate-binding protein